MWDYIMCVFMLTAVGAATAKTPEDKYILLGIGVFTTLVLVYLHTRKK